MKNTATADGRFLRRVALAAGVIVVFATLVAIRLVRLTPHDYDLIVAPLTVDERRVERELQRHVETLAGRIGPRNVGKYYEGLRKSADYVARELAAAGVAVERQSYVVEGRVCDNVVGEKRGVDPTAPIVVVSAHYDTFDNSPGANDDATGVGALIEIARAMRSVTPLRTVRFVAFVNEEDPYFKTDMMGSFVYARLLAARREQVAAMLSLETIGYYTHAPGSQIYPFPLNHLYKPVGDYVGFVSDLRSRPLLGDVLAEFRATTNFPAGGAALPASVDGVDWSDHWAFWRRDIPAMMITDSAYLRYPYYHSRLDTPEKIDYESTAHVVTGVVGVVKSLALRPTPLDFARYVAFSGSRLASRSDPRR